MPISKRSHIGTANKVCDITSGGVSNIPIINAPTITYGLLADKLFGVLTFVKTNKTVITGTSNAKPNAKKAL